MAKRVTKRLMKTLLAACRKQRTENDRLLEALRELAELQRKKDRRRK